MTSSVDHARLGHEVPDSGATRRSTRRQGPLVYPSKTLANGSPTVTSGDQAPGSSAQVTGTPDDR